MDVTVQFNFKMPVNITKKRKWHVASCPLLDVHSQGETETKAKNNADLRRYVHRWSNLPNDLLSPVSLISTSQFHLLSTRIILLHATLNARQMEGS